MIVIHHLASVTVHTLYFICCLLFSLCSWIERIVFPSTMISYPVERILYHHISYNRERFPLHNLYSLTGRTIFFSVMFSYLVKRILYSYISCNWKRFSSSSFYLPV